MQIVPSQCNISSVCPLGSVKLLGQILDTHGIFTICHSFTLQCPSKFSLVDLDFIFSLRDYGIVVGFKTILDGNVVEPKVISKGAVPKPATELITLVLDSSATDSFVCHVSGMFPD